MNKHIRIWLSIFVFSFGITNSAHGTLMGDSVAGSILNMRPNSSVIQFDPQSAVVGPGIEFVGKWLATVAVFHMVWDVNVDIVGSTFQVGVFEITDDVNNLSSDPFPFFGIQLTDLNWNGLSDGILGVQQMSGGPGVNSILFTPNSITVLWDKFPFGAGNNPPHGGNWTFEISGKQQESVPEPATILLFGFGIAVLVAARRKRKFAFHQSSISFKAVQII